MGLRAGFLVAAICGATFSGPSSAGTVDLSSIMEGLNLDYKVVLGYAVAMRTKDQEQALINGPVDTMQIKFSATKAVTDPQSAGIESLERSGLPTTINFDDANRNFNKNSLLNNRASAYGEMKIGGESFGGVASGAYFYDQVFDGANDNTSGDTVNNDLESTRSTDNDANRTVPVNAFTQAARETSGEKHRLLEAYVYGNVSLGESIKLNVRYGRHLAAWGESLFFPGIVAAQGPFDATKAFVPGAEVKEIILPTKQASMNMAVGSKLTVLGMYQFEFKETEIFPMGDFFSPADLVGPGGHFGYGSINPVHQEHCLEPEVTETSTNQPAPPDSLCQAGTAFENEPEYVVITRTADKIPKDQDPWGAGLKYQLTQDLNVGAYYLKYNNHNPNVQLNMGFARVGDVSGSCASPGGCQEVTTEAFGAPVPVTYTVAYADNVEMKALSFSTVFWVFNIGGEIIQRDNIDTSLESTISGVVAPWGTRGKTTQAQLAWLYVNNPDFLYYDEVIVVGEAGWVHVDEVTPVANQPGVCMSGTTNCADFTQKGDVLFYDKESSAVQILVLAKGRNVFNGWDLGTPASFAWLFDGTPSTPGVFGSLYGEGDMRYSVGLTLQYLQNLEFSANYNGFLGDPEKHINNSTLKANPYADHDYLTFTVKYNL